MCCHIALIFDISGGAPLRDNITIKIWLRFLELLKQLEDDMVDAKLPPLSATYEKKTGGATVVANVWDKAAQQEPDTGELCSTCDLSLATRRLTRSAKLICVGCYGKKFGSFCGPFAAPIAKEARFDLLPDTFLTAFQEQTALGALGGDSRTWNMWHSAPDAVKK